MARRVVMTGIGVVSGLGLGPQELWAGLCAGRSAIGPIGAFDASGFRCSIASEVPGLKARDFVPKSYRKAVKVMARDTQLAVAAARMAVRDAGLITRDAPEHAGEDTPTTYPADRIGCHIGAGLIAAEVGELTSALATAEVDGVVDLARWGESGIGNLQPLWLLKYLPNMLACHVTILHGLEGPSNTITCAETSGLLSLGESMRVIERSDADACLSGGAESKINLMGLLRLDLAGRLAPTDGDTDPAGVCRPYDPEAPGSVLGEGGGIFVLEEAESARARGATPIARLVGFGAGHSSAALDALVLDPEAPRATINDGLQIAIEAALADAGLTPGDIDAIVPQASGHRALDAPEAGTLRAVFGDRLGSIPLVTLTPTIGECLAGRGALQAAAGALCLHHQQLPARVHGASGSVPGDLQAGAHPQQDTRLGHVLVCTSAHGGSNAALVLAAASSDSP